MRKFHYVHENAECVRAEVGSQSAGAINIYLESTSVRASERESIALKKHLGLHSSTGGLPDQVGGCGGLI
jgi:hypothetical protein